jgi:hypothetical protein
MNVRVLRSFVGPALIKLKFSADKVSSKPGPGDILSRNCPYLTETIFELANLWLSGLPSILASFSTIYLLLPGLVDSLTLRRSRGPKVFYS